MGQKTYTEGFKQNIVRKLLTPGGPTATALALELGLSNSTRSRWKQRVLHLADDRTRLELMAIIDTPTRPTDRPAEDKLRMLIEARGLSDDALGAFLRREGIQKAHLDQWQREVLAALSGANAQAKPQRWAGEVRSWERPQEVVLNPDGKTETKKDKQRQRKARAASASEVSGEQVKAPLADLERKRRMEPTAATSPQAPTLLDTHRGRVCALCLSHLLEMILNERAQSLAFANGERLAMCISSPRHHLACTPSTCRSGQDARCTTTSAPQWNMIVHI